MKVMVIGAGLGGLCVARGLVQQGVQVVIHERDALADARFQGYRIGLSEESIETVKWCLPPRWHPLLDSISGDRRGAGRAVDPQLNLLGTVPAQDEGRLFDRHVLRHLLLTGLDVRYGDKLEHWHERTDGTVRAVFADGGTDTGDLLVAADGMGSTVRRQLLPTVRRIDLGVRGVIGRTPLTDENIGLVPGFSTLIVGPEVQMFLGKMQFRVPPQQAAAELAPEVVLPGTASYLRWLMLLGPEHPQIAAADQDPAAGLGLVQRLIATWHPDVRKLINQADRQNSGLGPLEYTTPIEPWRRAGKGGAGISAPITLLGDAAHPMPPGGLGANLAFRDAKVLRGRIAEAMRGELPVADALAVYEGEMLEYGARARTMALRQLVELGITRPDQLVS